MQKAPRRLQRRHGILEELDGNDDAIFQRAVETLLVGLLFQLAALIVPSRGARPSSDRRNSLLVPCTP